MKPAVKTRLLFKIAPFVANRSQLSQAALSGSREALPYLCEDRRRSRFVHQPTFSRRFRRKQRSYGVDLKLATVLTRNYRLRKNQLPGEALVQDRIWKASL